jgi:hypothetical protein
MGRGKEQFHTRRTVVKIGLDTNCVREVIEEGELVDNYLQQEYGGK